MATANRGRFVWYEYYARELQPAISFYRDVVGWTTQPFGQGGEYTMWVASQGPLGGAMQLGAEAASTGMQPRWISHVQVDDVDATAALARKRGGKVWKEPADIPTVGRFAMIGDPQGASLAIFKPSGADMAPHDVSRDGEFCWNELLTSDSEAAFRFYSELFGWKILEEMDMGPMGKYRIFGLGETRFGGMMTTPKEQRTPPTWLFYASTGDLDGATRRATGKGARVMNGPMDVPGGRVVQLVDPQGAAFALHQAAAR